MGRCLLPTKEQGQLLQALPHPPLSTCLAPASGCGFRDRAPATGWAGAEVSGAEPELWDRWSWAGGPRDSVSETCIPQLVSPGPPPGRFQISILLKPPLCALTRYHLFLKKHVSYVDHGSPKVTEIPQGAGIKGQDLNGPALFFESGSH